MGVIVCISVSVDGYATGPDDRPGQGLGVGGERLVDGSTHDLDLEIRSVHPSRYATQVRYALPHDRPA